MGGIVRDKKERGEETFAPSFSARRERERILLTFSFSLLLGRIKLHGLTGDESGREKEEMSKRKASFPE